MKKFFAATAAALMVLALAGCQGSSKPKTAEELVTAVQKAMEKTPCTAYTSTGALEMDMNIMGFETGIAMTMEEQTTVDPANSASHTVSTTTTVAEDETETETVETYTVEEDGAVVNYTLRDGSWSKTTLSSNASLSPVDFPTADLTFDPETTTEMDGKTAYVLSGTMSGADMLSEVDGLLGIAGEDMGEADASQLSVEITLYIDSETCLPIRMDATVYGFQAAMQDYIDSSIGEMAAALEEEFGDLSALGISTDDLFTFEVGDMTLSCDYTSYVAGETITVPDEAKAT